MQKSFLIVLGVLAIAVIGFFFIPSTKNNNITSSGGDVNTTEKTPTATAVATIHTAKGDIVMDLYGNEAPNTVANFIDKAKGGFYNNLKFHRVEDWVIQGGDPKGDGTGGGTMKTELNSLTYKTGALGVARGSDINVSNDSQFFIVKKDSTFLDNQYTNFGQVTAGMDVVNNIAIGDKITGIDISQQ